jgi:hypothetical protein
VQMAGVLLDELVCGLFILRLAHGDHFKQAVEGARVTPTGVKEAAQDQAGYNFAVEALLLGLGVGRAADEADGLVVGGIDSDKAVFGFVAGVVVDEDQEPQARIVEVVHAGQVAAFEAGAVSDLLDVFFVSGMIFADGGGHGRLGDRELGDG